MLSIDEILQADDRGIEEVQCPEWGGSVFIRTLTARDRDQIERAATESNQSTHRALLVALSLCDEDGKRVEVTPAQIDALSDKASAPMERIVDTVLRLNTMRPSDVEDAKKN